MEVEFDRTIGLADLTLAEARALLPAGMAERMLGASFDSIIGADAELLLDVVARLGLLDAHELEELAGLRTGLLDVNNASPTRLAMLPGISHQMAQALVGARPFFSLDELADHEDLAAILGAARHYVFHPGYGLFDKPADKLVWLVPLPDALLVRSKAALGSMTWRSILSEAGLDEQASLPEERIKVCRWTGPEEERAVRLRALKSRQEVETVAPLLRDPDGNTRVPLPDRLDALFRPSLGDEDLAALELRWGLERVQAHAARFFGYRLAAPAHDLGSLYRTLLSMSREPAIEFAEPTYISI
jgi:hypothetical protein